MSVFNGFIDLFLKIWDNIILCYVLNQTVKIQSVLITDFFYKNAVPDKLRRALK